MIQIKTSSPTNFEFIISFSSFTIVKTAIKMDKIDKILENQQRENVIIKMNMYFIVSIIYIFICICIHTYIHI